MKWVHQPIRFHVTPPAVVVVLQVKIADGRLLVGDFQCLDPEGNLVLANTVQRLATVGANGQPEERHVGMVIIPAKQQDEVHCQVIMRCCCWGQTKCILKIDIF